MLQLFIFPQIDGTLQEKPNKSFFFFKENHDPPDSSHDVEKALNVRFSKRWVGRGETTPDPHEFRTSRYWVFLKVYI